METMVGNTANRRFSGRFPVSIIFLSSPFHACFHTVSNEIELLSNIIFHPCYNPYIHPITSLEFHFSPWPPQWLPVAKLPSYSSWAARARDAPARDRPGCCGWTRSRRIPWSPFEAKGGGVPGDGADRRIQWKPGMGGHSNGYLQYKVVPPS